MKIKKINKIRDYKSFTDFNWAEFCKDKTGTEQPFNPYNILYGENGCGKSSICEILKDLSQHTEFSTAEKPTYAEIKVDANTHKFQNGAWDSRLGIGSILFFDQKFIDENMHTNGDRSNEKNRHSQNSGKLLVELDAQAITKKEDEANKKRLSDEFEENNAEKLRQIFTPLSISLYNDLKDKNDEELTAIKASNALKSAEVKARTEDLKARVNQTERVLSIALPSEIKLIAEFPPSEVISELFNRKFDKTAEDDATAATLKYISNNRAFIDAGLHILDANSDHHDCPFCLQPMTSQESVINTYKEFFNQTYKLQKEKYLEDISSIVSKFEILMGEAEQLPFCVKGVFQAINKVWEDNKLSKIFGDDVFANTSYDKLTDESIELSKYPSEIHALLTSIGKLKYLDNTEIFEPEKLQIIKGHFDKIASFVQIENTYIRVISKKIEEFKAKYSDVIAINDELSLKEEEFVGLDMKEIFFNADTINRLKEFNQLTLEKSRLKDLHLKSKRDLDAYITSQAPTLVLRKMMAFLGRFNLLFSLEPFRLPNATSEVPFSFKIIDADNQERNIKTGLSEGERQLVSLAFFFAINDNIQNKNDKILVFDDPITSLDAANLKTLADLIHEQVSHYSQVFILTHHPLFHKYLTKKDNPNGNKFGLLKNIPSFGGTFIFYESSNEFDLHADLIACHNTLLAEARSGTLNIEACTLRYGHILRLSVERFIKNELLLWNKDDNFSVITSNLKSAKSKIRMLSDANLENIEKVYKYCNYANFLHADKEAGSVLTELLSHIDDYVTIVNLVRTP